MATVAIMEFASMPVLPGGVQFAVPVGMFNAGAVISQPLLTVSTAATASSTFSSTTNFIRVYAGAAVNFAIGASGSTTATTTSSAVMPAGHVEYFGVPPGAVISVISAS